MVKDKKRKRDSAAENDTDQPPTKTQVVEDGNHAPKAAKAKKGGERRQIRSERKKKRALQAKENAMKKKAAKIELAVQQGMNASTASGTQDGIATGQNFVSLSAEPPKPKKDKGRSPRNIRKEARQKKLEAQLEQRKDEKADDTSAGANPRFICFVGNLPYTVTAEQVAAHFVKIEPTAVRLQFDKRTEKCKGFAFLEFDSYDKMKTCLKLYHHSTFGSEEQTEDGNGAGEAKKDSKFKPRKINVELTAGGGGKSEKRKDKIKAKNHKLNEERARDFKKKREGDESSKSKKPRKEVQTVSGANAEAMDDSAAGDRGDIHPSRLNRVRG